jgi:hypothetical protein
MKRKNTVWIVEMSDPNRRRWTPTVAASLTREDARHEMRRWWKINNPDYRFRVAPYGRSWP